VAAATASSTPDLHRATINQECGWKGGDRGGLAQGKHLEKEERKKKKREKMKEMA
jgi:hypothetical protein